MKKTVWLGEPADNPVMPPVLTDGAAAGAEIVVPIGRDSFSLARYERHAGLRVNRLTSVGTLSWQVWPMRAQ